MPQTQWKVMDSGSVEIKMEGSALADWFSMLQICVREMQDGLEQVNPDSLNADDQQVYEWISECVDEVDSLCDRAEIEMDHQKTESKCEFFYGPVQSPSPEAR